MTFFTWRNWTRYILLPFLVTVAFSILPVWAAFYVSAQDTDTCDYTSIQPLLRIADEQITDGDPEIIADTLAELAGDLSALRAACAGLSFSSEADGAQPVIPVTLDAGTWAATILTDGLVATSTTLTDGTCDLSYGTIGTVYPDVGESNVVIVSEGCTFLLEIQAGVEAWKLWFERVDG